MLPLAAVLQKYGIEYVGKYYSSYRGVVVSNNDPDNLGRILVYVPSVQGGIKVWAKSKTFIGGLKYGLKFLSPKPGEIVWVEFEKGNPLTPIWSYHGWGLEEVPDELKDNNTFGIITPRGHKFYFEEEKGKLTIQIGNEKDEDSNVIKLTADQSGNVDLSIGKGTSISINQDKITVNGGTNKGLVNLEAIKSLAQALQKDLLPLGTGSNLTQWMSTTMMDGLEDTKFTH